VIDSLTDAMKLAGYIQLDSCVYCDRPWNGHVGPDYCVAYDPELRVLSSRFLATIVVPEGK
jgi:hypothetical protein